MFRTTSKKTERDGLIVFWISVLVPLFFLPDLVMDIVNDDYSQYDTVELVGTIVLLLLAVIFVAYLYYMITASVIYARARCEITNNGVKLCFRCPLKKD